MTDTALKSGNLDVTLATWIFLLFDAGFEPADAGVLAACRALRAAGEAGDMDALGMALVAASSPLLGEGEPSFAQVEACARALFGDIATDLGAAEDRDERLRAIRRYEFGRKLPWIARIYDRAPSGVVGPLWVMVREIHELVHIMDPYPWDDVDEQVDMPVVDFMVKWELAGCESVRVA
ncbi:MAG: hypothetical protein ABIO70_11125 [Pseudomonadota bacterium]